MFYLKSFCLEKGFLLLFLKNFALPRDDAGQLLLDVRDLSVHLPHHIINSSLIILIHEGKCETSNPSQNDEGHHVKPGADVCEAPETEDELEGVEDAFKKEESPELHDGGV